MKILAIIINLFLPGIGTLFTKKWVQAILQILLVALAFTLNATGIGAFLGIPIFVVAWIWALITGITYQPT
ncbi:MAG: hypothetical protein KDI14_12955 [Halioglobus sp.]|nr:hypothetical protein [Halioglobus sp.]